MESLEQRIGKVKDFINDIDPTIEANVVPITDAFGPSIEIENLGVLVVSQETKKGGDMVNQRRVEKGLPKCDIFTIDLIVDEEEQEKHSIVIPEASEDQLDDNVPKAPFEIESKVSSSIGRFNLLGELLKEPNHSVWQDGPYVIGLTGGIASGKTSVSHRLEKLGAKIIDNDKLGHRVYEKGTVGFKEIVDRFGNDVVDQSSGEIDRKKLGAKVFGNKKELDALCAITWPKIADLLKQEIDQIAEQDRKASEVAGKW